MNITEYRLETGLLLRTALALLCCIVVQVSCFGFAEELPTPPAETHGGAPVPEPRCWINADPGLPFEQWATTCSSLPPGPEPWRELRKHCTAPEDCRGICGLQDYPPVCRPDEQCCTAASGNRTVGSCCPRGSVCCLTQGGARNESHGCCPPDSDCAPGMRRGCCPPGTRYCSEYYGQFRPACIKKNLVCCGKGQGGPGACPADHICCDYGSKKHCCPRAVACCGEGCCPKDHPICCARSGGPELCVRTLSDCPKSGSGAER